MSRNTALVHVLTFQVGGTTVCDTLLIKLYIQCEAVYAALGRTGRCVIHGKTFEHLDSPRNRCCFNAPSPFKTSLEAC